MSKCDYLCIKFPLAITNHSFFYSGNFSSLSTKFNLQRQLGYYVLQKFIPTILIVALSWVGFWIDERSVPARVSLGITTVLAITTLLFGIQSSLPRVGHVKAIDVFLLGSFLFVFAALVEFAIVGSFTKVFTLNRKEVSKEKRFNSLVSPTDVETGCKDNGIFQQVYDNKLGGIQVSVSLTFNYENNCFREKLDWLERGRFLARRTYADRKKFQIVRVS